MKISEFLNHVPVNGVESVEKLEQIKASLLADGWVGAPVVVHEGMLITGSHRLQAVSDLASDLGYRFDVPTVELSEVFDEAGLDLDEVMENENSSEAWDSGFVYVLNALPESLIDAYGIQWG